MTVSWTEVCWIGYYFSVLIAEIEVNDPVIGWLRIRDGLNNFSQM